MIKLLTVTEEYNLLKDVFGANYAAQNWQEALIFVTNFAYWTAFVVSIFFFGFKIFEAWQQFSDMSPHAVQKHQSMKELIEPMKGLFLFNIVIFIFKIVVSMIFGFQI